MKKCFWILMLLALFCSGCPETDECSNDEQQVLSTEELITSLAEGGMIVNLDGDEITADGRLVARGIIPIAQKKSAVVTCDPFGWGPEYDWLCTMTGTKGRALGKNAVTPTINDIGTYIESGSEQYPGDITSTTYFSRKPEHYPNYLDTVANPAAFFGLTVAAFGPPWGLVIEEWCTNIHIPFCIQE